MLTELDLNLLKALHALLTERHVTRAGQRIGLTQPAMSAALARLRRFFDDELLVRRSRGYTLTPLGEQLVEPIDSVMHRIDRTLALRAGFDPTTSQRELRIQLSDYALFLLMGPLLARVAEEAPGVRVRFEELTEGLRGDLVDLVIAPYVAAGAGHMPLWSDPWVIAVAADHPEVGDTISREQVSTLPYVQFQAVRVTNPVDAELAGLGVELEVTVTVSSFMGALFMVADTDAFTFVPRRLGTRFATVAGTRLLEPPIPLSPLLEHALWDASRGADSGILWLRGLVNEVVASL